MTEQMVTALVAAFGVDARGATCRRLPGGYTNETWRVDAAAGSFVVRLYGRLHVTRAALAFEHAVQAHVARRIDEVVAPLRDPSGQTLHAVDGGYAAVLPFIPGVTGRRDLRAGRDAARMLARFHRAAAGMHVAGGMRSSRTLGILPWLRERFMRFAADPALAGAHVDVTGPNCRNGAGGAGARRLAHRDRARRRESGERGTLR
ncbi:MAG: phosphotransferase enzyme family protein [Candidatus Velthaea sp.]